MFLDHYGLHEQPFGVTPNPRFLYPSPGHREVLASLMYSIQSDLGFSALIAGPGMGKTTLLFDLLERYRDSANTAFLFNTQCKSREFMRCLLTELGVESNLNDVISLHEQFKDVLIQSARDNKKVLLIIDEAHNLHDSVLETVRLLSNFETAESKLLHIILAGQTDLADRLMRPQLTQLFQRIAIINRLQPFTFVETCEYIDHRLRVAGYNGAPIFNRSALKEIAEYSQGVPRAINRFCFGCMSIACALGHHSVDLGIVEEVRADLDLSSIKSNHLDSHETAARFPVAKRVAPVGADVSVTASRFSPSPPSTVESDAATAEVPPIPRLVDTAARKDQIADRDLENLRSIVSPQRPPGKAALGKKQRHADYRTRLRNLTTICLVGICLLVSGLVLSRMPALVKSVVHELNTPAQASSDTAATNPVSAPAPEPIKTEKRSKQRLSAVSQGPKKQNTTSSPLPAVNVPSFSAAAAPSSVASPPDPLIKASGSAVSSVSSPTPDPVERPAPPPVSVTPEKDDPDALATLMANVSSSTPPVSSDLQQKDSAALLVPGRLIDNPRPVYPQEARRLGLQGTVLLSAVIGKDGHVMTVQAVSGHPILASAAEDAVRKWKYTPSTINGQPVQVATQIKLNFNIGSKE